MSLLVLHCFAQLAAEQIRCGVALICSPGAVLANGWAGKKLHLGLKLEKAAAKGCPEPQTAQVFSFFEALFPMDLWDLCCPSAPSSLLAVLVFGRDAKRNRNQTHFQYFWWFWGEGIGMAPLQGCALPASGSPLLVSPTASSVGTNPGKAGSIPVGCAQGGPGGSRGENAAC